MKHVFVTLAFPDKTGAPRMAFYFIRALLETGVSVTVMHGVEPEVNSILPEIRDLGARTRNVGRFSLMRVLPVICSIHGAIRQTRADCVIGFQQRDRPFARLASQLAGVPCVISVGGQHLFWGTQVARWAKEQLYRWCTIQQADLALCTSPVVQRELVGRFGVPQDRTIVLYNGIDISRYQPPTNAERATIRNELGFTRDDFVFVNVGRIDRVKGQDVLARALPSVIERAPSVKLLLVGGVTQGGNRACMQEFDRSLRASIDTLGLNRAVRFVGWRDDVSRLLQAADAYVHSARSEGPPWPLSVMEAAATSLPIIFTTCSGVPKGFHNGVDGEAVPVEDSARLGDAMVRVATASRDERRTLGEHARSLVEREYDVRQIGSRFVQLLEQCLNSRVAG